MKIVYCLNSLSDCGGIERVTIAKANALASLHRCEVWLMITDNSIEPIIELGEGVHLVDLQIDYYVNQSKNPIVDAWRESKKRRKHREVLRQQLNLIAPDVVVSAGLAEKNFLPELKVRSNPVFVRELHFCKHYRTLFADTWLKRVIAKAAEWYDYHWCIDRYDQIVVLTETERRTSWSGNDKVAVIPNPIIERPQVVSDLTSKVVLAVGRLTPEKNFASLLRAWKIVEQRNTEWQLNIWGEGGQRKLLENMIAEMSLKRAFLKGYSPKIADCYSGASIVAVTSRYEGFGMMIAEAMAAGVPVVAYDCPSGPGDIITNGVNGWLVRPGDEKTMAERICWMIDHISERQEMGTKALQRSLCYDLDLVIQQWLVLFEKLKKKKC